MIFEESFYKPKLKVLALTPGLAPGGAEAWLSSLIRHSHAVQFTRVIAVTKDGESVKGPVVDTAGVPVSVVHGGPQEAIKAVKQVGENYDVIMYWGLEPMDLRFTGRPVVHVIHFSAHEHTNEGHEAFRLTFGATHANFLACVSESGIASFAAHKRKKTDVRVIHNGVDVERTRPIHGRQIQRAAWGLREHEIACLYVGRFARGKGPEKLIEAVSMLDDNHVAVIYGWGHMYQHLRELAKASSARVVFPQPRLSGLGDVYAAADVLVIPSSSEAFPLVLIEGWQAGVPVTCAHFETIDELEDKHEMEMVYRIPCPPSAEDVAVGVRMAKQMPEEQLATLQRIALSEYTASAAAGRWERYFYEVHRKWMMSSEFGVTEQY